jgi:hypothetical protein
MKRLSLLLVMIITICLSYATIDEYYTFTATTGTYTPITGADAGISSDDAITANAIPLGFTFPYGDQSITQVKISSNGWIDLGGTQTGSNLSNSLSSTTIRPVVAPLWDDLSLGSGSCVYVMSGTAPNRVFTIEFVNASWNYSATNQFNFQTKLYETGKVEFIYGSATGAPSSSSASIGINMAPGGAGWYYSVTPGAPATVSSTVENVTIAAFPATGTVYQFNPVVAVPNDLACMSVTGSTTPTVGVASTYTITVRNRGSVQQTTYTVKLYRGAAVEIGTVAGTTIAPATNATFTIPWTPTTAGPDNIYGKVFLTGDQNATNDQSPNLPVAVQPAGVQAVTIGDGSQTARMPIDFYWKNSLHETLYYSDELGFVSGTITSLAFYNNFVTNLPNGATKIWLGTTAQTDLSAGWIPSTQMTLVFDGVIQYPAGANTITIPLQTPFMHVGGNLVMMYNRPMDTVYYSSSDNFLCQTGTQPARTLNVYSDSTLFDPAAPPTGTTPTGQFAKTTIFYSGQLITNDLGCLSITGNTTPSVGAASNYTISVKNNGTASQSTYQVKLFKEGNVEVGSVNGIAIAPQQTLQFQIPWTPTATGNTFIYGKVVMTGDEIVQNNQTANYPVSVQAQGVVAITVGTGGSTGRMPVDMFYMNSLFEHLYLASELNIGGLLTNIQFYNNFTEDLPNMPTNIWIGETAQTSLTTWIPSTQLSAVFAGTVNYPTGSNSINITLATPYAYGGGNLVVMVQRPMDTDYYSSADVFVCQNGATSNTLNAFADTTPFDPAAPPATATPEALFPKTTFMFITDDLGAISGTVTTGGNPLAGATVTVTGSPLTTTTSATGTYSFPYVSIGAHQVNATKHGFNVVSNNVTVLENQTVTSDFVLTPLPMVTVTGRIVGSDAPTVGIANATIALSGYEPYTGTTNASGVFSITGVYASQTYQYVAHATGYQNATGNAVVGTVNLNMGDITVNEMAYPPFSVVATENAAFTQCNVSWQAPNPNAQGITEGFEGTNFPPTDWTQVITDTNAAGTTGVFPTWCQFGTVALTPAVPPHGGAQQAGMWWDSVHQDEWLITPQFTCPGNANLTFWSYVYFGSTYADHYYVKVSTDNGSTWTVVWDATTLTGGWNYYTTPITVSLNAYGGQPIKVAWQAVDSDAGGMWYVWFLDDISIASGTEILTFPTNTLTTRSASGEGFALHTVKPNLPTSRAMLNNPKLQEPSLQVQTEPERVLLGYKVWRLLAANHDNETLWTSVTPNPITPTSFVDTAWGPLPSGVYQFAVKAVYTNQVMSSPAFSNLVHKGMMGVLTGTVTEFGTNTPIAGATITAGEYSGTSNAAGVYSFGVYQGTYTVTCAKTSYQTATQAGVVIVGLQTTTQNFVLTEITLPPGGVQATAASTTIVNITWMEPGTGGGEWIHYDSGENNDSIGTGGAADFDVAVRYPPTALADYIGMSLYAVKVFPAQAATFSCRVWTGGSAAAPGTQVVDQAFTATLGEWNTILLTNPVTITGTEELWFGYRVNAAGGYPAGCDAGPATDGFGNMIYFNSAWSTLLALAPTLDYNWNIQGYVGYSAPTRFTDIVSNTKFLLDGKPQTTTHDRTLTGYKVWRLLQGQESNETAWASLTPNPITATAWQDTGWGGVPDGTYKWSVKAIYTGGAQSIPAFSNAIPKITQIGTIAGIVRNQSNAPISGATVTCGTVTATTNASGAYSMQVQAGTWSVTASHPSYASVTQNGVIVVTGQTTTMNFVLPPTANVIQEGFEGATFPPTGWTQVITDTSAAGTSGVLPTWSQLGTVALTPPVPPHGGTKQAGMWWSYNHQDEWLITPQFMCPNSASLSFWSYVFFGSTNNDHYYVKVSTDNGGTWTQLWDATALTGGWNYYATQITIPLTTYHGQNIKLAWHADDPNTTSDGMWYCWFLDDVLVTGQSANDDPNAPVVATELQGNYPNPFNPETTIRYSVKNPELVKVEIYNVKGQLVRTLVNENKATGNYSVTWNGKDNNGSMVSSGIYYYKMMAGKYSNTRKMIMMK